MYPRSCEYVRATTVEEAIDLLQDYDDDTVTLLAGGHGVIPQMKRRDSSPGTLIDIGDLDELSGIAAAEDRVTIGALTRHTDIVGSSVLENRAPTLRSAAANVGDRQIRNRGTIGGNLVDAEIGTDIPPAVLVLDGRLTLQGPTGERTVDVVSFFTGRESTAIDADELLTEISLDITAAGGSYVRKTNPATGYALVGVAATVAIDSTVPTNDSVLTDCRVAVTGVTERPIRLREVEAVLEGTLIERSSIEAAAERGPDALGDEPVVDSVHASGEYRLAILPKYVEEAVCRAVTSAGFDVDDPSDPDTDLQPGGDSK